MGTKCRPTRECLLLAVWQGVVGLGGRSAVCLAAACLVECDACCAGGVCTTACSHPPPTPSPARPTRCSAPTIEFKAQGGDKWILWVTPVTANPVSDYPLGGYTYYAISINGGASVQYCA